MEFKNIETLSANTVKIVLMHDNIDFSVVAANIDEATGEELTNYQVLDCVNCADNNAKQRLQKMIDAGDCDDNDELDLYLQYRDIIHEVTSQIEVLQNREIASTLKTAATDVIAIVDKIISKYGHIRDIAADRSKVEKRECYAHLGDDRVTAHNNKNHDWIYFESLNMLLDKFKGEINRQERQLNEAVTYDFY